MPTTGVPNPRIGGRRMSLENEIGSLAATAKRDPRTTMQRFIDSVGGRIASYAVLCLSLWTTLILPRGLGWHSLSDSLWTEDSTIFLNQAYGLGWATLWTSYQGYLHTFQRLFCLLV